MLVFKKKLKTTLPIHVSQNWYRSAYDSQKIMTYKIIEYQDRVANQETKTV